MRAKLRIGTEREVARRQLIVDRIAELFDEVEATPSEILDVLLKMAGYTIKTQSNDEPAIVENLCIAIKVIKNEVYDT